MRAQESYINTSTAQVAAPGLFGGFPIRGLKNWRGGIRDSTPQPTPQCSVLWVRRIEEVRRIEDFNRSKFSPATGVRDAGWIKLNLLKKKVPILAWNFFSESWVWVLRTFSSNVKVKNVRETYWLTKNYCGDLSIHSTAPGKNTVKRNSYWRISNKSWENR